MSRDGREVVLAISIAYPRQEDLAARLSCRDELRWTAQCREKYDRWEGENLHSSERWGPQRELRLWMGGPSRHSYCG